MRQTKKGPLAPLGWVFLMCLSMTSAHAQTTQEIAKKAFRSTVLLVMEDANGQPLSLGSGFFVREGAVASNLHVIEGAARGYAKLVGEKTKCEIEGITAIDVQRDLVVLKISAARSAGLSFGNSDAVQVGDSVYAVGNPQGLEGTFSQGIVSSIRKVGSDKLLQITAPISPGSSGGPVLNGKGEVIGVSVATFRGGQNLNFAIPSNYLRVLAEKPSPLVPLAKARTSTKTQSILANFGGRSTEGVSGSAFLWEYKACCINTHAQGQYSFSLKNNLQDAVRDVHCLIVFYDSQGTPLDMDLVTFEQPIPPGLARRVRGKVDGSVQRMTTGEWETKPKTRIQFRILNFTISE